MKKFVLSSVVLLLAACNATQGTLADANGKVDASLQGVSADDKNLDAGLDVQKAVTVSDADLQSIAVQMRERDDKLNKVAPARNKYAVRLAKLTAKHVNEDGMKFNFKVYLSPEININATPDGSIRVYSGLMDKLNDQELLAVIGHEIGHVQEGHSLEQLRTAYLASAGRKAAASSSGVVGVLADSELGDIGEELINSQFSQSQETEADEYGLEFMKDHRYKTKAMESALRKLAAQSKSSKGRMDQLLSTHPEPAQRADHIRELNAQK